jgi:multidrug resistance efflux pump
VTVCVDPLRFDLADTYAKLRSDLDIRAETPDPHAPVIVKDPLTRGFYRFTWVQAQVLLQLDGSREPGVIAEAASTHCQVPVEKSQVEDFVTKLQALLLLDNALSWSRLEKLAKRKHRLLDSLLSIKIHAYNPDRFLTRMETCFGSFFFGPGFQLLAWASIAAGVILSIVNWDQLFLSWQEIFTLYSIPLILVVAFAIMTIHELAHGLTLKHFGGKVEEIGLLFLYFIPAFYCNVSDAWLLRKRERMLVSAAGGFIQLFLWAWATIFWRLLSPETLGSRICLIAIAFSGIQTLFNFNPLIRLDGYYLLSDYLETPNLRQKAFAYLRRTLRRWVVGVGSRGIAFSPREKRLFIVYGLAAFAFSAGLLWIILSRLGEWMVAEYRTWGILMFSMICLLAIPGTGKEKAAATGKLASGVRARIRKAPYLLIALAVLVAAGFLPWELKVTGDFTILPNAQAPINPQVAGTLKAIYVDEGSLVKKGGVLAEIQNLELSNAYEETRGELASSRAALNLLLAGSMPEEIERARSTIETRKTDLDNASRVEQERKMLQDTVSKKEAELQNARAIYERSKSLFTQGLLAQNDFERDQTAFDVKQKELAEAHGQLKVLEERTDRNRQLSLKQLQQARIELKILLAGSRKESIQVAEAQVAKLEEQLNILSQQLEQLKIRSPIDGLVATPYLKNRIGKYIDKGSLFCEIVDVTTVIVDMPIPEKEIGDVAVGYPIVLKVRTYPKQSFMAHVRTISPVAVEGSRDRTVVIRGALANTNGELKSGMTGVGKILCGKRMIGELVTRRAVRWLRTEFWEYLP